MKRKQSSTAGSTPIFRFRSMLLGVALLAVLISGPLLLVWKQVYINSVSMKMDQKSDSLALCAKEIAALRLECEHLSSNERIERIARSSLGLDYPTSEQIVIVTVSDGRRLAVAGWPQELIAFLRKSFWGDRG
jgi:cell division protein FtsL